MRNYRRYARAAQRGRSGNQDFWLSFSDLMSVLVLVFILVLFYILYQYFLISDAYQVKLDEMLVIEAALSEKETELATQKTELESAQSGLTEAQEELAHQQLMLNLAQQSLEDSETVLADKQAELDAALILLSEREGAVIALEDEIAAKQEQIDTQQAQLEELVGVRSRIILLLSEALKGNNISAQVDPDSGAILLESDVLFEYGSSDLSSEGKKYIDSFLPVYLDVLFSEENSEYVSEIIIEGHTDNKGSYLSNLQLSQERAFAVANYAMGESTSLDSSQKLQFRELLTANGRSFSDPIVDENGAIDDDASRRVVIKFRLTDEQMIRQMQDILE